MNCNVQSQAGLLNMCIIINLKKLWKLIHHNGLACPLSNPFIPLPHTTEPTIKTPRCQLLSSTNTTPSPTEVSDCSCINLHPQSSTNKQDLNCIVQSQAGMLNKCIILNLKKLWRLIHHNGLACPIKPFHPSTSHHRTYHQDTTVSTFIINKHHPLTYWSKWLQLYQFALSIFNKQARLNCIV